MHIFFYLISIFCVFAFGVTEENSPGLNVFVGVLLDFERSLKKGLNMKPFKP